MKRSSEPNVGRTRTWINTRIRKIYRALYAEGHCHTVEVYDGSELVGGMASAMFGDVAGGLDAGLIMAAGPEAGFSEAETRALLAAGYMPVQLGPRILRTETAALAAIAAVNAIAGDG